MRGTSIDADTHHVGDEQLPSSNTCLCRYLTRLTPYIPLQNSLIRLPSSAASNFPRPFLSQRWTVLLVALILIDLVFGCLHVLACLDYLPDVQYNLVLDTSYAERFQYLKLGSCALFMTMAFWVKGNVFRFGFALLFLGLFIEDAFQIHEQVYRYGEHLLHIEDSPNLEGKDYWELLYASVIGLLLAAVFGLAIFRGSRGASFAAARWLFVGLAALAVFGVGVDVIHSSVEQTSTGALIPALLGLVEDGGEMVTVSALTAVAFSEATTRTHLTPPSEI